MMLEILPLPAPVSVSPNPEPVIVPVLVRVSVPAPSLVRVPLVPVLIPVVLMVVLPAPPTVKPSPVPVIPPERVNVPASELIRDADPKVMAPDQVLLLARLRSAPPLEIPVPFNVLMGSPMERPLPSTCTAAPLATVVVPAVVPSALLFCTSRIPALTVVSPV